MNSDAKRGLVYLMCALAVGALAAYLIFAVGGRAGDRALGFAAGVAVTVAALAWIGGRS